MIAAIFQRDAINIIRTWQPDGASKIWTMSQLGVNKDVRSDMELHEAVIKSAKGQLNLRAKQKVTFRLDGNAARVCNAFEELLAK